MARLDTLIHASIPPGYDYFPGHRQPPFNEITLISSSNESPIEGKTRGRSPSVAGSSSSFFAVTSFDNVILLAPPLSRCFRERTTQQLDKTKKYCFRCPW
jgi:hypothetical protein